MEHNLKENPLICQRDLCRFIGVSRSTLFRWEKDGSFPRRLRIGQRRIAWRLTDVEDWLKSRRTPSEGAQ